MNKKKKNKNQYKIDIDVKNVRYILMVLNNLINMRKFIRNKIKQGNKRIYAKGIRRIHMVGNFGVGDMGERLGSRNQKIRMRIKIKIRKMEMEMDRVKYIVIQS